MDFVAKKLLQRRIGVGAQMKVHLLWWMWHAIHRCFGYQCICRCASYAGVGWHQCIFLGTQSPQVVYMLSCVRNLFISVWERGGGVLLVYDAEHLLLAWGVIVDMRKIGVLTVFSLFSMGVGVYVGICVCICTCTNAVSDVRPGVGTRRFKSWKNPDGLSLRIHISICVYKVYTYMSLATALWPVDQSHCFLLLLLRIIFNKHPNIKKKLNQYRIKSESNVLRICFFIEI